MAKRATFIQASVPAERGPAKHIETDNLAMTSYRIRDGKPQVEEIHTPPTTLQRIHEVMHARHSTGLGADGDYPGINRVVAEIVEDCRLHIHCWPWRRGNTPPEIAADVRLSLTKEIKDTRSEKAKKLHPFARFGTNLRAAAVDFGMQGSIEVKPIYDHRRQDRLAGEMLDHIYNGRHQLAAAMLHKMFFGVEEEGDDEGGKKKAERERKYRLEPSASGVPMDEVKPPTELTKDPVDEVIERHCGKPATCEMTILPLTEPTIGATDGWRMATTGSRIHRPSLRRPVLPQRLFMKRSPQEPGGAIIFDASGSMRIDNDVLKECCRRAPTAAVAFYKGDDSTKGKIWVFAYNGMRAKEIGEEAEYYEQGNSVDGQAIDWLLAQDGPRIMVTDRGFCGSSDSRFQIQRLATLEERGDIQVYASYKEYMEAHKVSEHAA